MYGMSGRYGLSISIFVNTVYIYVYDIYIYIYLFIYLFMYLFICVREAGPKTQGALPLQQYKFMCV